MEPKSSQQFSAKILKITQIPRAMVEENLIGNPNVTISEQQNYSKRS